MSDSMIFGDGNFVEIVARRMDDEDDGGEEVGRSVGDVWRFIPVVHFV